MAVIIIVVVVGLLIGLVMGLRSSSKTGMPSQDVLDRATAHERDVEAQEKVGKDQDDR